MPTPNDKESEREFISRCVPIVIDEGTTKDPSQAAAICYSKWREFRKKLLDELAKRMFDKNK